MKPTNIVYKLFPSIVNVFFTFLLSLPFLLIYGNTTKWKIIWIGIFFLYNCTFEFAYKRCLGMMLFNTHYEIEKTSLQKILYILLYTVSFSTLLFYIWFPFDLLMVNVIFIQLPCILITGNTLHGLLSGGIETIRKDKLINQKNTKEEFGLFFWIHILALIPAYLSPIIFDWKLIILGIVILQIQYWIIGGCLLTHLDIGKDKNETFMWYYLSKIYPALNPKTTKFVVRVIVPIFLVLVALILQIQFKFKPLINLWN